MVWFISLKPRPVMNNQELGENENEATASSSANKSAMPPQVPSYPADFSDPMVQCVKSVPETPVSTPAPSTSTENLYADTPDKRIEVERLKTFQNWPIPFLKPEVLAKNGFYYLGRGDEVRCAFCKVEIMQWMTGDDPAQDHQRWAPQCPFLRFNAESGNVPLEPAATPPTQGRDECGVRAAPIAPVTRMPGPVHSKYVTEAARLRSFKDWPRSMPQKPEDLVEAGFFYTGQGDKTKCFYCDGGLKDWEAEDVPWEQHARWFDRCAYVQLVKGREYVEELNKTAENDMSKEEVPETKPEPLNVGKESEEEDLDDPKLCKICYAGERNVCFVPCGHVVACAKCALSTNKCPMCRRTFHDAVRLYYA